MNKQTVQISAALCVVWGLVSCMGSGEMYSGGHGRQLVIPTRGYTHPGWTGKQVYEARQECVQRVQADPQYKAMNAEVLKQPKWYEHPTKEQEEVTHRWHEYEAQSMGDCIRSKGLKYGKIKPEDYYRPPPPPEWDWVKPGVDLKDNANDIIECTNENGHFHPGKEAGPCMEKRGYKYQIVDPHPAQ